MWPPTTYKSSRVARCHSVSPSPAVPLTLQSKKIYAELIPNLSTNMLIELDDGKIYRKPLYLMVKTMVSCGFSLKPIHWYARTHIHTYIARQHSLVSREHSWGFPSAAPAPAFFQESIAVFTEKDGTALVSTSRLRRRCSFKVPLRFSNDIRQF